MQQRGRRSWKESKIWSEHYIFVWKQERSNLSSVSMDTTPWGYERRSVGVLDLHTVMEFYETKHLPTMLHLLSE